MFLLANGAFVPSGAPNASCNFYDKDSTNCHTNCGACFNPGARAGVMCNGAGDQRGYYCPGDGDTGDITFACMDWTAGSTAMGKAEAAFKARTGEDVILGVGTFGTGDDPQSGLGACYRMKVEGVAKDILAQSINTGHDVAGNQFDLMIGAGGAGAFNTCAGSANSMYPGSTDAWGCQYGGVDSRDACSALPEYPRDADAMKAAGDSLSKLCEFGWDNNLRLSGAGKSSGPCKFNPTLLDVSRVKCPEELVQFTWAQRTDEPATYRASGGHRLLGFPNDEHTCKAQEPGQGAAYCLTRMMDCRKPSGAFKDNVHANLMVAGRKVVQTCTADGYTRIDVQCGCFDCNC